MTYRVTSTPGRMPIIKFSDDADYSTLESLLSGPSFFGCTHGWCVEIEFTDGTCLQIAVASMRDDDVLVGHLWDEGKGEWDNEQEVNIPLEDISAFTIL